jgi:hypothetical protein
MSDLTVNDTTPADVITTPSVPVASPETDTPEVAAPETPASEPAPVKDEGKAARDAMQRRINTLTAEKYRERARAEAAERQAQQAPRPAGEQPQQLPHDVIEREAARIAEERAFTQRCNDIAAKWKAESKTFATDMETLTSVAGPLVNDQGKPEPLLLAVMDAEAPHKVLAHLAANPDLAATLADLTPLQQARQLALIEHEMSKPITRQPANTPKPLEPVSTQSTGAEPDPADTERWIKWRNKQVAESRR